MKNILSVIARFFAVFVSLIVIYIIAVLLLPIIPVQKKPTAEIADVPIYIYTNGVHTDLVMPIRSKTLDWSDKLPFSNTKSQQTDFDYVGIGWGDKGFYLDTPTWSQLKPTTAFYAAFWLGESAMHCTFYKEMQEGTDCKKIMLTQTQFQALTNFVDSKFDKNTNGQNILIPTKAVYGDNDSFYEAQGSYSFLNTCNTWTNNALKIAGQKAALWTATDFGIFHHYR